MATWIAHFRIAERILDQYHELDRCTFAVGNIAPDSGIPNEDWSSFTPPSEVTHFLHEKVSEDLRFYQTYIHPIKWEQPGDAEYGFRLGYFCHLVCDNLWRTHIAEPVHEINRALFEADPAFIWTVKEDWYALDFEYVRTHPHSLFWSDFLSCCCPPITLDFLLEEGVRERIRYIKEYYQRDDDEINAMIDQPRKYLHKEQMDAFIDTASSALLSLIPILRSASNPFPEAMRSALSLLS